MTVNLHVIQGRPEGKTLTFPAGDYYIGRGAECHLRPDSDWVSRQHCLLRVTDATAYLKDLGSRNGTLVNGVLISTEQQLNHGDRLQFGPLVFEVRIEAASDTVVEPEFPTAPPSEDATKDHPAMRDS